MKTCGFKADHYLHVFIQCLAHRKLVSMFMTIIILKLFPAVAIFAEENSSRWSIDRFNIIFYSSIMTTNCAWLIFPSIRIKVNMSKGFQGWESSLKEYTKVSKSSSEENLLYCTSLSLIENPFLVSNRKHNFSTMHCHD